MWGFATSRGGKMFVEIIINRRDADLTVTQFDAIRGAVKALVKESEDMTHRGSTYTRDTLYIKQVETDLVLEDIAKQLRACLPEYLQDIYVWSFCTADDSASGTAFICLELDD
jgi:hypothetical protein